MLRLGLVFCLTVALPLTHCRRYRPKSEVANDAAKAAQASAKGESASFSKPSSFAESRIDDPKDELSESNAVKSTRPVDKPELYDPSKKGLCPKIVPHTDGGPIPSMVIVTVKNVQNLPWSYLDTPDAYVEFWTGDEGARQYHLTKSLIPGEWEKESYWRARTPVLGDDTNPLWDWSCLLVYDYTDPSITFQVWDRDKITNSEFLGKASGNMLEIFQAEDERGYAEFDVKFRLMDKNGNAMHDRKGQETILTVNFDVVREKSLYEVVRRRGFEEAQLSAHREAY